MFQKGRQQRDPQGVKQYAAVEIAWAPDEHCSDAEDDLPRVQIGRTERPRRAEPQPGAEPADQPVGDDVGEQRGEPCAERQL